ncbi:MAG: hypothetical protein WA731_07190, partial [Pseudonocardiaceae bacterium]
ETATSSIRRDNTLDCTFCCRIWLYEIKHAACGGADVAELVALLACPRADPACCARPGGRARAGRPVRAAAVTMEPSVCG